MNTTEKYGPLNALENMDDWKVHHNDTDIRGWNIYTTSGEKIGEIENLIADKESQLVRYAEVEIDDNINRYYDSSLSSTYDPVTRTYFGTADDDHILIPIGLLKIDTDASKVTVSNNWASKHFANSPRYIGIRRKPLTPAYELATLRYYASNDEDEYYRENYYTDDQFDFNSFGDKKYIGDSTFYNTDFFDRDRYFERRNKRSTTMTNFGTGSFI